MELKEGMIIELQSKEQFRVDKVFAGGYVDLIAMKAKHKALPDFFEKFYSVQLVNYKIVETVECDCGHTCPTDSAKQN